MKIIFSLIFTLIITYSFGQTQVNLNKVAYAEYQKADKELNEVYRKILVNYKTDTVFINSLKAAQRVWIDFRDAELKMRYPEREAGYYGSVHPVCRANYLEKLTRERTKKLKEWLNEVAEGDACSGSIRTKR